MGRYPRVPQTYTYFSPSHFQLTGRHWPVGPHWNSSALHSGKTMVQFSSSEPSYTTKKSDKIYG
jgi:hypothetical protein